MTTKNLTQINSKKSKIIERWAFIDLDGRVIVGDLEKDYTGRKLFSSKAIYSYAEDIKKVGGELKKVRIEVVA